MLTFEAGGESWRCARNSWHIILFADSEADPATWSAELQEAVRGEELGIVPFDLKLDYNYWTYRMYVRGVYKHLNATNGDR